MIFCVVKVVIILFFSPKIFCSQTNNEIPKFCNFEMNIIPFELSLNLTQVQIEAVKLGLKTISHWSCLKFVPRQSNESKSYFRFTLHPDLGEQICRAPHISRKCQGVSLIYINCIVNWTATPDHVRSNKTGPSARDVGLVIHEVLHTLGFLHEQQRPDRNQYVQVWPQNSDFPEEMEVNFETPMFGEPYDIHSIMHYGWDSWQKANTWGPVVLPKEKVYLGVDYDNGRYGLTVTDVRKIRIAYECEGGRPIPDSDAPQVIQGQQGSCEDSRGEANATHFTLCAHRRRQRLCDTQYSPVMRTECPASCQLCQVRQCLDVETKKCRNWKETTEGICKGPNATENTGPTSCTFLCGKSCARIGVDKSCVDWHHRCKFWAAEGNCVSNPKFMLDKDDGCLLSCGYCDPTATVLEPMALKADFSVGSKIFGATHLVIINLCFFHFIR